MSTIVGLGVLAEAPKDYLRARRSLEREGHSVLLADIGVSRYPAPVAGDLSCEEVARAAGATPSDLVGEIERLGEVAGGRLLGKAAGKALASRVGPDEIVAAFSMGGPLATAAGIEAFRALPLGKPKVVVTTAPGIAFVEEHDIALVACSSSEALGRAGQALGQLLLGMLAVPVEQGPVALAGVTALGVTTQAVMNLEKPARDAGIELVVAHARTRNLDLLCGQGWLGGVIDLTPAEAYFERTIRVAGLGRDRLAGTLEAGLPLVICPGSLDMLALPGSPDDLATEYAGRPVVAHTEGITLVRSTAEEVAWVARKLSEQANLARDNVTIVVPLRGFSRLDKAGDAFFDPVADAAFLQTVRARAAPSVRVVEVDAHINDPAFADAVMQALGPIRPVNRQPSESHREPWGHAGGRVAVIATLDTKGAEAAYLNQRLAAFGLEPVLVDVGLLGEPEVPADVSREEVALAANTDREELVQRALGGLDRREILGALAGGAARVVERLAPRAVVGLGGSVGSAICLDVFRGLPSALLRVMLSTQADLLEVAGTDVLVMQAPVDIMCTNPILRRYLAQGAGAVAGLLGRDDGDHGDLEASAHEVAR